MTRLILSCALLASPLLANNQLEQISDNKDWLGYFVGWESRNGDFGIGADGESLYHVKKQGKRVNLREIKVRWLVEERVKDKWRKRKLLPEGGLSSDAKSMVDPDGPVKIITTVTGGTKVEWTHSFKKGKISFKPRILEKTTENPIRVGVHMRLPRLYPSKKLDATGDDYEKLVGNDYIEGRRFKDGKKVKIKFEDRDEKPMDDDKFGGGLTEVEVKADGLGKSKFVAETGSSDSGLIELQLKTQASLHRSFSFAWYAIPDKVGTEDCYFSFEMD